MNPPANASQFFSFLDGAIRLAKTNDAEAIVLLLEEPVDWKKLMQKTASIDATVVASNEKSVLEGAEKNGLKTVLIDRPGTSIHNQLTLSLLSSVAQEYISPSSTVVAVYGWFDQDDIDSISLLRLNERLGRLSAADLRKLKTEVPLETLRTVVDLSVEIGREGREGKPIGTMFVVGDHRKVLKHSRAAGFEIIKGYARHERDLLDSKIHDSIKELAQMDGCFVVSSEGVVEGCCRIIDTLPVDVTMTRGLGARHFAAAAISKNTKAIAVVVSQSGGTVRIYQDGEVVLRIETLPRPMKWKAGDAEPGTD